METQAELEAQLRDVQTFLMSAGKTIRAEWGTVCDLVFAAAGLLEAAGEIGAAEDLRAAVRASVDRVVAEAAPSAGVTH